jgi:hypothetical protein
MPVVYIHDSTVKDKVKLKLKPGWVKGLHVATGQWGLGQEDTVDGCVCVQKRGGVEEELFISTVLFYISLYPNIRPMFELSVDGNTLLCGPSSSKLTAATTAKQIIPSTFSSDMTCTRCKCILGPAFQT